MVALGLSQIGGLTVYAFSPSQLDVFAQPVAGGFAPIAPSDILAASGAVAALDGPQFENCSGQNLPYGNASYAQSQCGYPQFLVQGSAIAHPGSRPNEGHTLSVVGGQVSIAQGAQVAPGASVAVQLWPPLVIDSQVVASNIGSNVTVERRAALAVLPGGMLAFIVGSDDMYGFASSIQALGATFAGYTDGGGSAALVPATGGSRPVPTWLIARASGGSMGPILGALILGGIAAGILYATLKIKPRSNPTAIQDDLGIRTTEDAIWYVERQSEPKGWPGDVEIVTIPFAEHLRTIRTEKDRSVYPIRRIPVRSLRITQPVVDRALVIQLLRSGWSEPILVSSRGEILDGHHRAYAASLRGDPYILARVVPAVRANPVHSLDEIARSVVDTRKIRSGDDIPGIGYGDGRGALVTYHVTDDPQRVVQTIKKHARLMSAYGPKGETAELGPGLYASGNPSFWLSRSKNKWEFLKALTEPQRDRLIEALRENLTEEHHRGLLSHTEFERATRDLGYIQDGRYDFESLVLFASLPYGIAFWKPEFLKPLGIRTSERPTVLKLRITGLLAEVDRTRPDPKVLRSLRHAGVVGVFTKSSMGTNPELVIWDSHAIRSVTDATEEFL